MDDLTILYPVSFSWSLGCCWNFFWSDSFYPQYIGRANFGSHIRICNFLVSWQRHEADWKALEIRCFRRYL